MSRLTFQQSVKANPCWQEFDLFFHPIFLIKMPPAGPNCFYRNIPLEISKHVEITKLSDGLLLCAMVLEVRSHYPND